MTVEVLIHETVNVQKVQWVTKAIKALIANRQSLSRDLFAKLAFGCIVAATVEVSFFVCSGSVTIQGVVKISVSAMVSMTLAGGVPKSYGMCSGILFCEKACSLEVVYEKYFVFVRIISVKKKGVYPLITELQYNADSSKWGDVLFFCREAADEDKKIATKLNRLREEMMVIREKRMNLVEELRSVSGIVVIEKAAEFVSKTVRKDNAQIEQLRKIESHMEVRSLEKELRTQKIVGNIPY
nr:hypothetical protein [Tanacetum cinerariifolium]